MKQIYNKCNLNGYFLERMGTHAVTLSVLVTKRHRF